MWGVFVALIIVRRVQAPFFVAIPSFPFNCFLSLTAFISRQLWMKCSGLLQWQKHFSSVWASFTTLANWTMNSSVTPSIPPGSLLSGSSPSSAFSSSRCAKQMTCFLESGWLPLSFLKGKKLVVLGLEELLVAWILELQGNSIESSFLACLAALR